MHYLISTNYIQLVKSNVASNPIATSRDTCIVHPLFVCTESRELVDYL